MNFCDNTFVVQGQGTYILYLEQKIHRKNFHFYVPSKTFPVHGISYNMGTRALPDMYALRHAALLAYICIKQSTIAHVTCMYVSGTHVCMICTNVCTHMSMHT